MVALMTNPITGQPCGLHRTYLLPDGTGKAAGVAKMMLGAAGVVRLVPDIEVHAGLGIAEGIESALAVMQHFDWSPVWAATSAGSVAAFPVIPGIAALTIFSDPDEAGLRASQSCAARWEEFGSEACIMVPPKHADFNDLLRQAET